MTFEAGPAGPRSGAHRSGLADGLGGGAMFTQENSYTLAMVAALTVAMVTTLVALAHALHGVQFFW